MRGPGFKHQGFYFLSKNSLHFIESVYNSTYGTNLILITFSIHALILLKVKYIVYVNFNEVCMNKIDEF